MEIQSKTYILFRYIILAILSIQSLFIIYAVFTPLTLYPSLFLLKVIYGSATLLLNNISFSSSSVTISGACVAGAAYYLLLILNLTTPMSAEKRVKSLLFTIISFLLINIIRIVSFASLFDSGFRYFDISHTIAWHIGSTIILVALWFTGVRMYKITSIPVITDVKNLIYLIKE